ncbi:MAG: hypothetical protein A2Z21_10610 [Candidatus Fraserbacteria bacterium RBG_16_55_9]|uniref:DAGKc domain-containing protein n=1 Tax=Fraserbacteria sp. (strain RBG_16_55_9) TaxID=1817864 RepID=A0A1F5UQA6_FRAXR|nr:MAG: hypothetical protein A2Z21_10610 [Candidatus Fraserbacteria bacterium RBG_16_55_9]
MKESPTILGNALDFVKADCGSYSSYVMDLERAQYQFIVNPKAGRGKTQAILPALRHLLDTENLPCEFLFTSGPGDATALAREAIRKGCGYVVAVGGDGTVHEIANALVDTTAALGVIPTGSGNDFCKAVQIPLQLANAVETVVRGQLRRVDVGRLGKEYFVNGLGIGLDGAVSHRYGRMKRLRGEWGYLWGAIHEALTFKAQYIHLKTADWSHSGRALLAGVSNGQYHGGNFKLAPHAVVDDGLFDIYVIGDMFPLKRLLEIPKVRKGTHLGMPEVETRRAPWVEITSESSLLAHMDGEPFQLEPGNHRIELVPRSLQVICAEDPL